MIFSPILNDKLPQDDGTKYSFVGLWDTCIRNPLEHLIPDGVSIRSSGKSTSTRDDRPDYALILSNVCPFRERKNHLSTLKIQNQNLGENLYGPMIQLRMS